MEIEIILFASSRMFLLAFDLLQKLKKHLKSQKILMLSLCFNHNLGTNRETIFVSSSMILQSESFPFYAKCCHPNQYMRIFPLQIEGSFLFQWIRECALFIILVILIFLSDMPQLFRLCSVIQQHFLCRGDFLSTLRCDN